MNNTRLLELRSNMINLLGWYKIMAPSWPYLDKMGNYSGYSEYGENSWCPDNIKSGQIWIIINRLKDLDWKIIMDDLTTPGQYDVEFIHKDYNPNDEYPKGAYFGSSTNPCIAIMIAAEGVYKSQG
jgi:hypothetical protein